MSNDPAQLAPLEVDDLAFVMDLEATSPSSPPQAPMGELAVFAALYARGFSGRCECYSEGDFQDGSYRLAVGLRHDTGEVEEDPEWWEEFAEVAARACAEDFDLEAGELVEVGKLQAGGWADCGAVLFAGGKPEVVVSQPPGAWFAQLAQRLHDEGDYYGEEDDEGEEEDEE